MTLNNETAAATSNTHNVDNLNGSNTVDIEADKNQKTASSNDTPVATSNEVPKQANGTKLDATPSTTTTSKPENKDETSTKDNSINAANANSEEHTNGESNTETNPKAEGEPEHEHEHEIEHSVDHPENECTKKFTEDEVLKVDSLYLRLDKVFEKAGFDASQRSVKIWNIELNLDNITAEARVVLVKFIRARDLDLDAATEMLSNTLKWRKEFKPEEAANESFPDDLFGSMGFVHGKTKIGEPVTYNLYGTIKDQTAVFGDVDRFLRWRVGLMEKAVDQLDFKTIETMVQVHDYGGVSVFAGRTKEAKEAAKKASQLFSDHYPELLSTKWFINVPSVMTWIFSAFKLILSAQTIAKFRVVGSGKESIHDSFKEIIDDDQLPVAYGGKSESKIDQYVVSS